MKLFHCPRCGRGKLFKSTLDIADKCGECGLSFAGHEQGDGPAFFSILFIGAATAIGAAVVEIRYTLPFWVQGLIWVPFILIGSIVSLRVLKAAMIAMQYHRRKDDFN